MEQLKRSKNRNKGGYTKSLAFYLCFAVVFILVLIPLYFTPISSDDFIYITNSSKWSDIAWRYMNWSGRLVADSASLFLLQLPSIVYKIIKALIWSGLIAMISQLPAASKGKLTWSLKNFVIVFLLYWIANPNLGQTSFWTVGFANYILTNFFIVAYFALAFYIKETKVQRWQYLAIPFLGLLAGNSNENTSIVVVLLTIIFLLIEKRKKVFLLGLPFTIVGTLGLLLSPGQQVRLQNPIFQDFRDLSVFRRLWEYFSSPWFIDTFKSFSWVLVAFIFIGFMYFFKRQIPQKNNLVYCLIFFFSAIIANAAFGGSYVFPVSLRSLNGALIFFLISLAFFMEDLSFSRTPIYKRSILYFVLLLCLPFGLTYYFATKSVISLHGQFQVREQAILDGKKQNQKKIYIPNYNVGKLYNPSDSIDLYQGDIVEYYDTKATIVEFDKDFSFDYSDQTLVNSKQIPLNRSFGKGVHLKAMNIFPDERVVNKYSINLTFDRSLLKEYSSEDFVLFIHVNWKKDTSANEAQFIADTPLHNQLSVDGKYIFSSPIDNIRPQDISSVDLEIYNQTTKTSHVQTTIEMNDR